MVSGQTGSDPRLNRKISATEAKGQWSTPDRAPACDCATGEDQCGRPAQYGPCRHSGKTVPGGNTGGNDNAHWNHWAHDRAGGIGSVHQRFQSLLNGKRPRPLCGLRSPAWEIRFAADWVLQASGSKRRLKNNRIRRTRLCSPCQGGIELRGPSIDVE